MLTARWIVENHIDVYGMVPHPDKMKEAIARALVAGGRIHESQGTLGAHTRDHTTSLLHQTQTVKDDA